MKKFLARIDRIKVIFVAAAILLGGVLIAAQQGVPPGAYGPGPAPGGLNGQLQYNNAGALGGVAGSTVTAANGQLELQATADNVIPFEVYAHSATQTQPLVDYNNSAAAFPSLGLVTYRGKGVGSFGLSALPALLFQQQDNSSTYARVVGQTFNGDTNMIYFDRWQTTTWYQGVEDTSGNTSQFVMDTTGANGIIIQSTNGPISITPGTAQPLNLIPLAGQAVIIGQVGPGGVTGLFRFAGGTSGSADISVAAAAGTPNKMLLPTTTGSSGFVLRTDGANPQQLSWIAAPACATCVQTGQTNVYGAFLQDFTAATMEIPEAAGFAATVDSTIGLDTTANITHLWTNGADSSVCAATATDTTTTHAMFATAVAGVCNERAIAAADISTALSTATTYVWNNLANATGALTLANGTNATTFNQTNIASWTWANTTTATSGTSQSSPIIALSGKYWDGAASQTDTWQFNDNVANGTNGLAALNFTHTGSTSSQITIPSNVIINSAITLASNGNISINGNMTASVGAARFANYETATANHIYGSQTAPTIAGAGCGGSGASITSNNGTFFFTIGVGTTNTGACTITMPSATTGWYCSADDITNTSATISQTKQTSAPSQTSVTLKNFTDLAVNGAWTDSDVLDVSCMGN